jgi:hypothetical protein
MNFGEMRNGHRILVGKPEGRGHSKEIGVDRRILKWILGKWDFELWVEFI